MSAEVIEVPVEIYEALKAERDELRAEVARLKALCQWAADTLPEGSDYPWDVIDKLREAGGE